MDWQDQPETVGPATPAGSETLPAPLFDRLSDMLASTAGRLGDKPALICGGSVTSYDELLRASISVANALTDAGVKPGDRVVYLARNRAILFELMMGCARIAATLVPVNWRLVDDEIAWILDDVGPSALFVGGEFAERLEGIENGAPSTIVIGGAADEYLYWRSSASPEPAPDHSAPETPVLQIYTSGTTGRPKGAMLSQRALLFYRSLPSSAQPEWNRWTEDDVALLVTPQFHIGGCGYGLQTICAGATGVIVDGFVPADVLRMIPELGLSKLFVVPTMLAMLLHESDVENVDYGRIRTIVYGASPITENLLRESMRVFGCGFVQQYGMTELAGAVTALPPDAHDLFGSKRMRSAGQPLPGTEIIIVDPDERRLGAEAVGEILIKSNTAMNGYWRRPEANAAAFQDGYYRTGDAGYLDAAGYLYVVDRLNDMIVSGGENVYPAEVENLLNTHPAVHEAAVVGVQDPQWGERVKAVVVLNDQHIAADELVAWCRDKIAGYKVPRLVEFVDVLPRNAAGKVIRRALR
jgi:long-chain acyl-CoA synthetase